MWLITLFYLVQSCLIFEFKYWHFMGRHLLFLHNPVVICSGILFQVSKGCFWHIQDISCSNSNSEVTFPLNIGCFARWQLKKKGSVQHCSENKSWYRFVWFCCCGGDIYITWNKTETYTHSSDRHISLWIKNVSDIYFLTTII